MAKSFAKKNRKLRNGKNKVRLNNQVPSEEVIESILSFIDKHSAAILNAGLIKYKVGGRGCFNISFAEHPDIPFPTGNPYYVTEKCFKEMQSEEFVRKVFDEAISEQISAYDPTRQAVICVWYGTLHIVVTLGGYSGLGIMTNQKSLMVH
jgi:hypothetical protein